MFPIYFGYTHVSIGGTKLTLVASHVPALKTAAGGFYLPTYS